MKIENSTIYYNGNVKLKKAGVRQIITVFEQQEYVKCKFDVIYFIKKYVQIISLDEGVVPFHLFPYQEKMIKHMEDNRFSIFMTSRQMGKTTVAAGYILHELIFNKSFTVAIRANKDAQAREIMERVQMMYEELPFFLQPGVKSWNKGSISLGNKSRAFTAATSSSSVRGKSINLLYMDEFAHIENDTEFYQSTYPVIMSGKTTKVIITSTPNGMNLFYKIWTEAKDGRSQYKALQIYWNEHPNRDEAWLREQESNMPPKQIAQEIHCVVGDTPVTVRCVVSGAVFDTTLLELYEKQYERTGVVYKLTRADGLSYVGITLDLKKRVKDHAKTKRFAAGIISVETLFTGPYSECVRLEPFFVKLNDTYRRGLNVTPDGRGKT